jgi:hypothetical protein
MNEDTPAPPVTTALPAPAPQEMPASSAQFRRGLRWFLAEFLVVVAGILVAMSLNAWYQDRIDARSEQQYLKLLGRDLTALAQDLDEAAGFEDKQRQDALLLYHALSAPRLPADTRPLSAAVEHLSERRTPQQNGSTYQDLISTGHFQLIRNAGLRDRIAEFYQRTGRQFEVINKNNAFFIDQNFATRYILSGLVLARPGSNEATLNASDARAVAELAGGYIDQSGDVLWALPANAPEWPMFRSNVVSRLQISQLNAFMNRERAAAARDLKAALDAELLR